MKRVTIFCILISTFLTMGFRNPVSKSPLICEDLKFCNPINDVAMGFADDSYVLAYPAELRNSVVLSNDAISRSARLIEEYKKGTLTDDSLKEISFFLSCWGEFSYDDAFYAYLDSLGDYKTIIRYINTIISTFLEECGSDVSSEDGLFYIGDYPITNNYGLDLSKISKDEIMLGSEREVIHHMTGGSWILDAYNILSNSYFAINDYSSCLSTLKRLYEIVRTDWKWDPGERQKLFDADMTDDEYASWPFVYYFSSELDTMLNLADVLYVVSNQKQDAYKIWNDALALSKRVLIHLLSTGDYSVKSSRWNEFLPILNRFVDASTFKVVTPELSAVILDAVLFQNNYLTRLSGNVLKYISNNGDDALSESYFNYKSLEANLERAYYKKNIRGEEIDSIRNQVKVLAKEFYSLLPEEIILPNSDNPVESLNTVLSDRDLFVQFVSAKKDTTHLLLMSDTQPSRQVEIPNDYISAIVYSKKTEESQLIHIGDFGYDFLRNHLSAYNSRLGKEAIGLPYESEVIGQKIWKDILTFAEKNQADRIFFIPSGVINIIAIENLSILEKSVIVGEKYKIRRISHFDSIPGIDNSFSKQSYGIAIGGIQYGKDNTTFDEIIEESQDRFSLIVDRESVGKLIGTQMEMDSIYRLDTVFFQRKSGKEPTEEFFASLSGNSPQILHIGTHGINKTYDLIRRDEYSYLFGNHRLSEISWIEKAMYETGLLVAPSDEINTSGFLSAKEISGFNYYNTDLLSLSACSTGLGIVNGEGVNGLPRAWKMAGVNSILASLWNVNDEATSLLMNTFYRNYIVNGLSKNESLRRAKESLRTINHKIIDGSGTVITHNYADPYYWAGFVLID